MKIERKTLTIDVPPKSLVWREGKLMDWVSGGNVYELDGKLIHSQVGYAYTFDAAIQSRNGVYVILYEKVGTKAIILKNGEVLREIHRSYYQANAYEYPICFVELAKSETGIIHCPNESNQIEIELVESGKNLLSSEGRDADDCFHSRFKVNSSHTKLINLGWVWHPYGIFQVYDVQGGIKNPAIFDNSMGEFPINAEVSSAEFLDDDLVYISSTLEEAFDDEADVETLLNPGEIGLYSIKDNKFLKKIAIGKELGNLIPIDENFVIELFDYPTLIDMNKGEIVLEFEDIKTGKQNSSIIWDTKFPPIAVDRESRRIAIAGDKKIDILAY